MTDSPGSDFLNELGSDYQYGFHDPETFSFKSLKRLIGRGYPADIGL